MPRHDRGNFESRMALAESLGVEVRHDREQIAELFGLLYSRHPGRMIEVGSYQGGTALVFGGTLGAPAEMILIDLCDRKRAWPKLESAIKWLQDKDGIRVELFKGNSASLGAKLFAESNGVVDFLYIDGCHQTKMVIHDYMTFRKYVWDGGLIGFHDVCRTRYVKRAWAHMTAAWNRQGLKHWVIGKDEWDRKTRPWATGIGVVEWQRKALDDPENEARLVEIAAMVETVK